MQTRNTFEVSPVGFVRSSLKDRKGAPRQPWEGAPSAKLEIDPAFVEALDGVEPGQDVWVFTWLHQSRRSVLKVHPRGITTNPLMGVFATRSPDRPNPIGMHRVRILGLEGNRCLLVEALEAIDGTPIVDIKPVLERLCDG